MFNLMVLCHVVVFYQPQMRQQPLLVKVFVDFLKISVKLMRVLFAQMFKVFKDVLEVMRMMLQMLLDLPFCLAQVLVVRVLGIVVMMLVMLRVMMTVLPVSSSSMMVMAMFIRMISH